MSPSSIDWLIEQLTEVERNLVNKTYLQNGNSLAGHNLRELFKQAKAMHKEEQLNTAHDFYYGKYSIKNFDEYYNETFNSQPKTNELTQLRKLAGLLQSAWHNGNWKAETYNEREMEKIMTEQGYWPALPNPDQIGKDAFLTFNTKEK